MAFGQDLGDLVQVALSKSQRIAAQRHLVREAELAAGSLRSPLNPELEIAPGVGFTNSGFALGQSFDVSGQRRALAQMALTSVSLAQAEVRKTELEVGAQVVEQLMRHAAARREAALAQTALNLARTTRDAVKKRQEIGEVPAIQTSRAELQVIRAEQTLAIAQAQVADQKLALGFWFDSSITDSLEDELTFDNTVDGKPNRPESAIAMAHVGVALADEQVARRESAPKLFVGIAADTWSLDRRPFRSENIGLQARLTMQPFDRRTNRKQVQSKEAATRAARAELVEIDRRIALEVARAQAELAAAQAVRERYASGVVPRAAELVRAMQDGYTQGFVTLLELLEAQNTLAETATEASAATLRFQLAQLKLMTALGQVPGTEVTR